LNFGERNVQTPATHFSVGGIYRKVLSVSTLGHNTTCAHAAALQKLVKSISIAGRR